MLASTVNNIRPKNSQLVAPEDQTRLRRTRFSRFALNCARAKGEGSSTHSYRWRLAQAAAAGAALGLAIELATGCVIDEGMRGSGSVLIGAMAGGWLSAAVNRRDAILDQLRDFLASEEGPWLRMGFVWLLPWAVAALLPKEILDLAIDRTAFSTFPSDAKLAFCLGLVTGMSERSLSVRLLNR